MRATRSVALLAAALSAASLVLASCGNGGSADDDAMSPQDDSPTSQPGDTPSQETGDAADGSAEEGDSITALGPLPTEPVSLVVWSSDSGDGPEGREGLREVIDQFEEEYPNIDVTLTAYDFSSLFGPRLRTAIAAKEGPDVVSMYGDGFVQSSGYEVALRPLYDLITPQFRERLTLIEGWEQVDPSLHALPYGAYGYVWYYNKELFQEAGLDPETPPETWDQLVETCESLVAEGITPIGAGFRDGFLGGWYHYFGFASQLFTAEEKLQFAQQEIGWDYPDHLDSLARIDELAQLGCFGENPDTRLLNEAEEEFRGQRAAMLYWTNLPGLGLEESLGEGNVGAFVMPSLPESEYPPGTMDAGPNNGWAITNFRPEVCRAAWEFITYTLSAPAQEVRLRVDGALPNNTEVDSAGSSEIAVDAQVVEWLANPENHTGPASVSAQEAAVEVKLWPELVAGRKTPQDFATEMQTAREGAPPREAYEQVEPQPCE